MELENYRYAVEQLAQTTLRSVLGEVELDDLLSQREKLNSRLQSILDEHTEPWGIKVTKVEVRQVDLPQEMQRAIAAQAEAERERRAKIIHADAEYQASAKLAEAAAVIAQRTRRHHPAISPDAGGDWDGKEHHRGLPGSRGVAERPDGQGPAAAGVGV